MFGKYVYVYSECEMRDVDDVAKDGENAQKLYAFTQEMIKSIRDKNTAAIE